MVLTVLDDWLKAGPCVLWAGPAAAVSPRTTWPWALVTGTTFADSLVTPRIASSYLKAAIFSPQAVCTRRCYGPRPVAVLGPEARAILCAGAVGGLWPFVALARRFAR